MDRPSLSTPGANESRKSKAKGPHVIKLVMPDTKTPSQRLKTVFQILKDEEIEPLEWITEAACKAIASRVKSTYFIIDPFDGEAFEHLKTLKCFIIGAQVMIQCIKDTITIPRCEYPVLHMALRGAVVSLSGVREAERDNTYHRIRLMYGQVEKSFTAEVTHLVTLTTGASSKKYLVAAEKGIPILSPKWLDFCWETGKTEAINGTAEDVVKKFRCPLFEGFKFCASGYSIQERNHIKEAVIAEGGTYSGDMKIQNCTHLIVKEPTGQKYQCAQKWKIRSVSLKWMEDSVAKGYCQDENNYVVEPEGGGTGGLSSTPEKGKVTPSGEGFASSTLASSGAPRFSVSDISMIDASHCNETILNSTVMSGAGASMPLTTFGGAAKRHVLDVDVAELTRGKKTLFLDGCKIYVCGAGLEQQHLDKCAKLINSGGATRFSTLNENVTHVLLERHQARAQTDIFQLLQTNSWSPLVVLPDWLVECARQGKSVSEAPFQCRTEEPLPEVDDERFLKPKIPVKQKPSTSDIPEEPEFSANDDFEDLLTQYGSQKTEAVTEEDANRQAEAAKENRQTEAMQGPDGSAAPSISDFGTFDDNTAIMEAMEGAVEAHPGDRTRLLTAHAAAVAATPSKPAPVATKDSTSLDRSEVAKGTSLVPEEVDSQMDSQDSIVTDVFKDLRLAVLGFDNEDAQALEEMIEESLGTVVRSTPTTLHGPEADFLVVPMQGAPTGAEYIRRTRTTTSCWVQMCTESQDLLAVDSNPMFTPFDFREEEPLQGCVVTITGYAGVERENLMHLANIMGAHVQELFVKKTKPGKENANALPNTHLLCQSASGQKYSAAKKWMIPAVGARWLFACAKRKKCLPTARYDIDKEQTDDTAFATPAKTPAKPSTSSANDAAANDATNNDASVTVTVNESNATVTASGPSTKEPENPPDETVTMNNNDDDDEETFTLNNLPPSLSQPVGRRLDEEQMNTATPTILRNRLSENADDGESPQTPLRGTPQAGASLDTPTSDTPGGTPSAHHPRVAHLRKDVIASSGSAGGESAPKAVNTPTSGAAVKRRQSGTVTPARFMDPQADYFPDFDFKDFLDELKTPEPPSTISPTTGQLRKHARKNSIPLDVLYEEAMKQALINTQGTPDWKKDAEAYNASQTPGGPLVAKPPPLQGVIIAVSKKLSHMQEQLNSLALDLGAEYRWTFDQSCTHFIYQGKATDANKEIKSAKHSGKYIVCPEWLHQCVAEDKRLDEDQFPLTYDGKKNLGTVLKGAAHSGPGGASPSARQTRTSARTKTGNDENPKATSDDNRIASSSEEAMVAAGEEAAKSSGTKENAAESSALDRCAAFIEATVKQRRQSLLKTKNDSVSHSPLSEAGSSAGPNPGNNGNTPGNLALLSKNFKDSPPSYEGSMPMVAMGIGWEDPTEVAERQKMANKIRDVCQQTQGFVVAPGPPPTDETFGGDTIDTIGDSLMLAVMGEAETAKTRGGGDKGDKTNAPVTGDKPVAGEGQAGAAGEGQSSPPPHHEAGAVDTGDTANTVAVLAEVDTADVLGDMVNEASMEEARKKVFQFSGLAQEEKESMKLAVDRLGGQLIESSNFEDVCTHLIVKQPARNEKFLACVASGRWVLTKSYLEESDANGRFLPEVDFEWGSTATGADAALAKQSDMTRNLAAAAHKWRQLLHERRRLRPGVDHGAFIEENGAFWKVLLITDKSKEPGLKRLLEAGGGRLIATKLPFTDDVIQMATHALLDERKLGENKDVILGILKSLDVKVFKPEYIPAYLQGADDLEQYAMGSALANGTNKRKAEPSAAAGAASTKKGKLSSRN